MKKLAELNAQLDESQRLNDADFALVSDLCKSLADPEGARDDRAVELLVNKMLAWPPTAVLPALDMVRAVN
jgi:hypothetical protein